MSLSLSADSGASNPGPPSKSRMGRKNHRMEAPRLPNTRTEVRGPSPGLLLPCWPPTLPGTGPCAAYRAHCPQVHDRRHGGARAGPRAVRWALPESSTANHAKVPAQLGQLNQNHTSHRRTGGCNPPRCQIRVSSPRASYTVARQASASTEVVLMRFQAGSPGTHSAPQQDRASPSAEPPQPPTLQPPQANQVNTALASWGRALDCDTGQQVTPSPPNQIR